MVAGDRIDPDPSVLALVIDALPSGFRLR